MQRTKKPNRMPDAINQSVTSKFTQVPNDLLRNPELSFKAKGILCLLLSNKEGWYSYITAIQQMTKEGEEAIRNGLSELEGSGYLLRIQYRDKQTKVRRGSFWAYTDIPGRFDIRQTLEVLDSRGMEPVPNKPFPPENLHVDYPDVGSLDVGNPRLKIPNIKTTNNKNTNSSSSDGEDNPDKIKSSQFEDFWQLYPRKDSKGAARKAWEKICRKKSQDRPTWSQIEQAIEAQKKSERWQEKQFIPLPTTWLNQERWLDDPAYLVSYSKQPSQTEPKKEPPKAIIRKASLPGIPNPKYFIRWYYEPAKGLLSYSSNGQLPELAKNLVILYQTIYDEQEKIRATKNSMKGIPERMENPGTLIEAYIRWLSDQSWMKDKQPNLFDYQHKLFRKFLSKHAYDTGANPITGKYPDQE